MDSSIRQLRLWTLFFIAGLVLSGATALPLATEIEIGTRLLGGDMSAHGILPSPVAAWLRTVRDGIGVTANSAPFLFYGTDWLAFGHFVIALAFVGALRDPVRNRWLYQLGMLACAAVPVWAFLLGPIRGIPFWWRCVDASFGIVGFLPVWLCDRCASKLENAQSVMHIQKEASAEAFYVPESGSVNRGLLKKPITFS